MPASTRLWHRTCKTSRGTSLRSWLKCTRLSCKRRRGTSLRSLFKYTRLWHRTCKTSHGTSLRSWLKKKCLLARDFGIERARLAWALRYARGLSAHGFPVRLAGALPYARRFSAHGFGTERARLARALRFARGLKKSASYLWGFSFFFSKYRRF